MQAGTCISIWNQMGDSDPLWWGCTGNNFVGTYRLNPEGVYRLRHDMGSDQFTFKILCILIIMQTRYYVY